MKKWRIGRLALILTIPIFLGACGNSDGLFGSIGRIGSNLFGGGSNQNIDPSALPQNPTAGTPPPVRVLEPQRRGRLFGNQKSADDSTDVNALLWTSALEVLYYLPIVSADPHSGRIQTGFGSAPGSSRAYRADIHITGGAADAANLDLALFTRSGRADPNTTQIVRDAILLRARQIRSAQR